MKNQQQENRPAGTVSVTRNVISSITHMITLGIMFVNGRSEALEQAKSLSQEDIETYDSAMGRKIKRLYQFIIALVLGFAGFVLIWRHL